MTKWYAAFAMNTVVFLVLIGIVLLLAGYGQAGVKDS